MTIVLDDMDANREGFVWEHATYRKGAAGNDYWVGSDWLPYQNNPLDNNDFEDDKPDWCAPNNKNNCSVWIHSLRGDWNSKYWDKTANQAYHFWFYVAVAYFDLGGAYTSLAGNAIHDSPLNPTPYDFTGSNPAELPPNWTESTQPDINLGIQGAILGTKLRTDLVDDLSCPVPLDFLRTDIGSWIRTHLK